MNTTKSYVRFSESIIRVPRKFSLISFAIFSIFCSTDLFANDKAQLHILGKVKTYISAYNSRDVETMTSVAVDNFPVTSLRKLEEGDRLGFRPFKQVKQQLAESSNEVKEENWDHSVYVDGDLAVVMLRHRLFLNGEKLHCGTDIYNLMKIDNEWLITGLQYSMEANGCPEDK